MDYGICLNYTTSNYMFNDIAKNGSDWEANRYINNVQAHDSMRSNYRVYSFDDFKVVNGAYWTYDADWSGSINNHDHGNNWSDTYINHYNMMVDQKKTLSSGYPTEMPLTIYKYKNKKNRSQAGIGS